MLACSGCWYPRPRHGVVLRGDWSLELNRVPWLKKRSTSYEETSTPSADCEPAYPPSLDCDPALPNEAVPKEAGPQQSSFETPCSPDSCRRCGDWVPGSRLLACRSCGRSRRAVPAEVGYQSHPRFHPVPVEPVFLPRSGPVPVVHNRMNPRDHSAPRPSPDAGAPQIHAAPSAPVPEQIRTPPPGPKKEDRVTRAPRRLGTASRSRSWIFNPPTPGKLEPAVEARLSTQANGRWIRR